MKTSLSISDIIEGRAALSIPLRGEAGEPLGQLVPLTRRALTEDKLLESMTRWRNRAARFFMTQFEATPERTRAWLSETVLADRSRLLFLVESPTKLIGHYGFKNLTAESAELDNLIRGEAGGHPKLIYYAEVALLRWLFRTFRLARIHAHVLADNNAVLELHRSVGFVDEELIPLRRMGSAGFVTLEYGVPGSVSPDGIYCRKIVLHRGRFEEEFPGV